MKNLLGIIFFLVICNGATAQTKGQNDSDEVKNGIKVFDFDATKDLLFPEYISGTVTLFGDTKLSGFIFLKENSDIKFKQSEDSKEKITYYSRSIKSIILDGEVFEYKTVINNSSGERMALKLEIEGDVMLYSDSYFRYMNNMRTKKQEVHYYLGKKNQSDVLHVGFPNSYSKKFRKVTEDYFGSCEALFAKTDNREFERSDIHAIVNFYNNECNKNEINE